MSKEKYTKFVFGETPTYFVAGIDMFMQCATWYDSEECWDKKILDERTLFASVGLAPEFRTNELKLYTFLNGTKTAVPMWRDVNIGFILMHLAIQKESKLYVIDGYPKSIWGIVEAKINDFIDTAWFGFFDVGKGRIKYTYCKDEATYLRERGNIKVLAEEHTRLYQPHLLMEETDMVGYEEYNKCCQSKMIEDMRNKYSSQDTSGIRSDPMTSDEIDKLYDDDDDDGELQ